MTEHLFKLKRDGKTAGYSKWTEDWGWEYSLTSDFEKPFHHFAVAQTKGIIAHPFVTKDKRGKDVFEGDKIYVFNSKMSCRVIWSATHRGWAAQLSENPKGLPMSFVSFYPRDIELIEDKEND